MKKNPKQIKLTFPRKQLERFRAELVRELKKRGRKMRAGASFQSLLKTYNSAIKPEVAKWARELKRVETEHKRAWDAEAARMERVWRAEMKRAEQAAKKKWAKLLKKPMSGRRASR